MAELRSTSGARKYGFSMAGHKNGRAYWNAYRISDNLPIGELVEHWDYTNHVMHYDACVNDRQCRTFVELETAFMYLCARAELAELESMEVKNA